MSAPTIRPPCDYPQPAPGSQADDQTTSTDISYAALLDRYESEQPITDEMIREACVRMEAAQQFPFAVNEPAPATEQAGHTELSLARWWRSVFGEPAP